MMMIMYENDLLQLCQKRLPSYGSIEFFTSEQYVSVDSFRSLRYTKGANEHIFNRSAPNPLNFVRNSIFSAVMVFILSLHPIFFVKKIWRWYDQTQNSFDIWY